MSGIFLGAAAIGLTAYGAIQADKADQTAASVDTATAAFNNKVDIAQAQQIDEDTLANIDIERQDANTYLSREAAGFAASGVIATTGSPLHAQLTNVGRFTQQEQQKYLDAQVSEENLYIEGEEGVALGSAQASADSASGTLALVNGAAKIAGSSFGGFNAGQFSGGGGGAPGGTNPIPGPADQEDE